jgi:hypothetical protein
VRVVRPRTPTGEDSFGLELQRFDAMGKLDEIQMRTSGSDALFWQQYIQAFVSCQADFYDQAAEITAKSTLAGTGGRVLQEQILLQEQALDAKRIARVALRAELEVASPTISDSDHSTLLDGWLNKQSFNISKGERSKVATRMAGYKKRWFVLRADGMMLYYKDQVRACMHVCYVVSFYIARNDIHVQTQHNTIT